MIEISTAMFPLPPTENEILIEFPQMRPSLREGWGRLKHVHFI